MKELVWMDPKGKAGSNCLKPLSRKKLKQLMPRRDKELTSVMLERGLGRLTKTSKAHLRQAEADRKFEEALKLAGVPPEQQSPESDPVAPGSPNIFRRMSSFFSGLRKRSEREASKG